MITKYQKRVLDFLVEFYEENNHPPTIAVIAEGLGLTPKTVHTHLKILERELFVIKTENRKYKPISAIPDTFLKRMIADAENRACDMNLSLDKRKEAELKAFAYASQLDDKR